MNACPQLVVALLLFFSVYQGLAENRRSCIIYFHETCREANQRACTTKQRKYETTFSWLFLVFFVDILPIAEALWFFTSSHHNINRETLLTFGPSGYDRSGAASTPGNYRKPSQLNVHEDT
jgi:hypothetical protein